MQIRDIMSRDVQVLSPDASLVDAARCMRQYDIGSIPVAQDDHLIGMVTDRDIVVRCVAEGHAESATVREAMTQKIRYCYDDQEVGDIAHNMSEEKIRRLPVVDRSKRLVGIVSLGDIAKSDEHAAGEAMEEIAEAPPPDSGAAREVRAGL